MPLLSDEEVGIGVAEPTKLLSDEEVGIGVETTPPAPLQYPAMSMAGALTGAPLSGLQPQIFKPVSEVTEKLVSATPIGAITKVIPEVAGAVISTAPLPSQQTWEDVIRRTREVGTPFGGGFEGATLPGMTPEETIQRQAAFTGAVAEQARGLAEFSTSKLGIATAALGGPVAASLRPLYREGLRRLISAGFLADIGRTIPDKYEQYLVAKDQGTPEEQERAEVDLYSSVLMAVPLAAHQITAAPEWVTGGREVIDFARQMGLPRTAAEVSRRVEPKPPVISEVPAAEAAIPKPSEIPGLVISPSTVAGQRVYNYTNLDIPGAKAQTFMLPADATPEMVYARVQELRRPEAQGALVEPAAVAPGMSAKAPEPAEGVGIPAKPEIASLGTSSRKNLIGDPSDTVYRATAKDHARIKEMQAQMAANPEVYNDRAFREEFEGLKNKYGGFRFPIEPIPIEVAAAQPITGEPYAGKIEGPVGVSGYTPPPSPQTLAERAPSGLPVTEGPRSETPETQKVGDQSALQRKETVIPQPPPAAAPPAPPAPAAGVGAEPPAPTVTGIKNAEMNRVRAELGMPPLEETVGKPDAELWNRTMERIDREPGWQDSLIEELKEKPRGHTDEEALALDHRLVELRTEHARTAAEAIRARNEGRIEDAAEAGQRATALTDKIKELGDITKATGTILGRALRSRQLMMNEDFSLAALEMKKREANNWEPMNEKQRAEIEKTHDDYVKRTAELEAHLAEQTARAVDAEIKLARAEIEKGPAYDPRLLKMVEGVASFMDTQAAAAMSRIRERMSGKRLMMDPTLGTADLALNIADASIIGAAKIARKISDFAKWSDAMVRDLGEWIKPHLQQVWTASQAQFEKTAEERLKAVSTEQKQRVKATLTGATTQEQIEAAKDKIRAKIDKGETDSLYYSVQKLVRGLVGQNLKITRDELIDTVHGFLKESLPNMTRMEAMDAISGRGRFTVPAQDEVSKTVRDLKTQTRLQAHILDIEAGKPLPRTGFQHGKLSDVARQMEQKLNEWKRKFGVTVTDPAAQLASVLSARKTYYRNRMTDLLTEIRTRERIVKTKTAAPTDPELEGLKAEYEKVRAEHDEIFERQGLTDEQRLSIAEKAAERQIKNLEEQIRTETVFPKTKEPSRITSAKLEAQRSRIEELKAERQWIRDRLQPGPDPTMQALQFRRAQMLRKIADYEQRMAEGDYAPRTRKPPLDITQDEYALKIMAQLEKTKRDFDKGLMLDEMGRRTKVQKIWAGAKEVLNLPRTIWSAFDVSAVGRQGVWLGAGHPIKAVKALAPMFRALSSESRALVEEQRLWNRENAKNGTYARAKLYLPPLDEFRLTRQEEIMMSRFGQLIPGVRGSNRAFVTYLNRLSAEVFDTMLKSRKGLFSKEVTTKELEAIANYINTARGRAPLGRAEMAGEFLATVLWSPRLMTSRFQLLAGHPMWRGTAETRSLIASEYARSLAGIGAMVGLGVMAGASIETDPNSADFLKLRFGNTRLDVFGGLIQNTILLSRILTGKIKTSEGKEVPARTVPLLGGFLRNKLTPALGITLDVRDILTSQKPPKGHPQTIGELAATTPVPLSFRDIYDLMEEQGVPAATAFEILSLFGFGVQTYEDEQSKTNAAGQGRPLTPVRRAIGTER